MKKAILFIFVFIIFVLLIGCKRKESSITSKDEIITTSDAITTSDIIDTKNDDDVNTTSYTETGITNIVSSVLKVQDNDILELTKDTAYDIYQEKAISVKNLYASNSAILSSQTDLKRYTPFYFKGKTNIIINGNNSVINLSGNTSAFIVDSVEGLTIRNITFRFNTQFYKELEVVSYNDGELVLKADTSVFLDGTNVKFLSDKNATGEAYYTFDLSESIKYIKDSTTNEMKELSEFALSNASLANNLLTLSVSLSENIKANDKIILKFNPNNQVSSLVTNSKNITLDNVRFENLSPYGLVFENTENIVLNNVCISNETDSLTSASDMIEISNCRGQISIKNSIFKESLGNFINIHSSFLEVASVNANKIEVDFKNELVFGFDPFRVGDTLNILDKSNYELLSTYKVIQVEKRSTTKYRLTLNQDANVEIGDLAYNESNEPMVEVINNKISDIYGICFNILNKNTIIKQNEITNIGLELINSSNANYNGSMIESLEFINNRVSNAAYRNSNIISLCSDSVRKYEYSYFNKVVKIINNNFLNIKDSSSTIKLKNLRKLAVYNNNVTFNINKNDVRRVTDTKNSYVYYAMGDSITEGKYYDNNTGWFVMDNPYAKIIAERLGVSEFYNIAVSGTCISCHGIEDEYLQDLSLSNRTNEVFDADLITIAYGTNDMGCKVPMGREGDTTDVSFYGAVDYSFREIRKNNPDADIYVISPIRRSDIEVNAIGYTLDAYRDVIEKTALKYGLYVISGDDFELDPHDASTKATYMNDGVHVSPEGHILYADFVYDNLINKDIYGEKATITFDYSIDSILFTKTIEVRKGDIVNAPEIISPSLNKNISSWLLDSEEFKFPHLITDDIVLKANYEEINKTNNEVIDKMISKDNLLLSGRNIMSSLNNSSNYYLIKFKSNADFNSDSGLLIELAQRYIFINLNGATIYDETSIDNIPLDFIRIYNGTILSSDMLKLDDGTIITNNASSSILKDTEYSLLINLKGKKLTDSEMETAYTSSYGTKIEDLPTSSLNVHSVGDIDIILTYMSPLDISNITIESTNIKVDVNQEKTIPIIYSDYLRDRSVILESSDSRILSVEGSTIKGISDGNATITITSIYGDKVTLEVQVGKGDYKPLNQELYLALSKTLGDETSSILYTFDGGPFRCDYMYVPNESLRTGYNAIEFEITFKKESGYLFIVDGTSTDIANAWGDSAGYQIAAVIGKDINSSFHPYQNANLYTYADESILRIYDAQTKEELTGMNINFQKGKKYTFSYRLANGHALSFFYGKNVYDNDRAICWGTWNSDSYLYDVMNSLTFSDFRAINMEGKAHIAISETFTVDGYNATVLIPENFNGKWLYKTEFFYAFDALEQSLYQDGYARVYFEISDMYGSDRSVSLMYDFYKELMKRYDMNPKGILLGFSRGGLYAFNFALAHPECVEKVYLDAPVLDLRSWPRTDPEYGEGYLHNQVMQEYGFNSEEEFLNSTKYPICNLERFFNLGIPTLLICGAGDTTVMFNENSEIMINYANSHNIKNFYYYVKEGNGETGGDHHPHSFGNVTGNSIYGFPMPKTFNIWSNMYPGTTRTNTRVVASDVNEVKWFFNKDFDSDFKVEKLYSNDDLNFIFFGDSISVGIGATDEYGWTKMIKEAFNATSADYQISGYSTLNYRNDFETKLLAGIENDKRNICFIALGTNDSLLHEGADYEPLADFENDLNNFISVCKTHNVEVVLIGLTRCDEERTNPISWSEFDQRYLISRMDTYDNKLKEIAFSKDVFYIELKDAVSIDHNSDGIHPNDLGYRNMYSIIARNLLEYLNN